VKQGEKSDSDNPGTDNKKRTSRDRPTGAPGDEGERSYSRRSRMLLKEGMNMDNEKRRLEANASSGGLAAPWRSEAVAPSNAGASSTAGASWSSSAGARPSDAHTTEGRRTSKHARFGGERLDEVITEKIG